MNGRTPRTVTDSVLARIEAAEGLRLTAYRDAVGVLTIGYGHTGPDVTPGLTISRDRAAVLLRADLAAACATVERRVTVPLTDNQFGALVSFVFNVGEGAFAGSTLLKKLNAGHYDAVPGELARWTRGTVGGRKAVLKGLVNRRAMEAGIWASGAFVASNTVPATAPAPARALLTPEAIAGAASAGTALFGAAANGGPLAWALALGVVAAVVVAGLVFVERLREAA